MVRKSRREQTNSYRSTVSVQSIEERQRAKKRSITKQRSLSDVTWKRSNTNKGKKREKTCVTLQSVSFQTCTLRIALWQGLKKVVRN